MKSVFQYMLPLMIMAAAQSCKKDNFDAPDTMLKGRLVYNGEPIEVEYNQVPFELYQFGFGKVGPLGTTFAPDGTYSMVLFKGEYKLIIPNGQGPFKWKQTAGGAPDSLTISLSGNQELNLEVIPYYMIRNPQFTASGGKVTAKFKIEKIITDASARNIENVRLYINKTQIVATPDDIKGPVNVDGGAITDLNNVTLEQTVPTLSQTYIYARIGLKIQGVEDRIFSPVQKIQL